MAARTVDTVIVSDIHLGSEMSRARDALDLLRSLDYKRLILLGDIFSDLNFSRLTRDHWKFLSCLASYRIRRERSKSFGWKATTTTDSPMSCRT